MTLLKTLEEAQLAFDLEYCTALELIVAVEAIVGATPELRDVEELTELIRLNRKQPAAANRAPDLLRAYLAANPVLPEHRPRALEDCGRAILKARLERYQDSNDLPETVCRMVSRLEHCFDFPEWLGDLYNVCDWCQPDSTREEFVGVRQEAERLVKLL